MKNSLKISQGKRSIKLYYDEIALLEGDGNYTVFILGNNQRVIVAKNLKCFEPDLPEQFVRVHKGTIVNFSFAQNLKRKGVRLKDGSMVSVARRRATECLRKWKDQVPLKLTSKPII